MQRTNRARWRWFRLIGTAAYVLGFFFAWRCWITADEPARAIVWLSAASGAFWIGRLTSSAGAGS